MEGSNTGTPTQVARHMLNMRKQGAFPEQGGGMLQGANLERDFRQSVAFCVSLLASLLNPSGAGNFPKVHPPVARPPSTGPYKVGVQMGPVEG